MPEMTERPTSLTDVRYYQESDTVQGLAEAHWRGMAAPPGPRGQALPQRLQRQPAHIYEFQVATNDTHFRVELLRVTVGFFGRVRREHVGVTDGPFVAREDAEAALTRRWNDYWRATGPSGSKE
jgi:hypothetical protein